MYYPKENGLSEAHFWVGKLPVPMDKILHLRDEATDYVNKNYEEYANNPYELYMRAVGAVWETAVLGNKDDIYSGWQVAEIFDTIYERYYKEQPVRETHLFKQSRCPQFYTADGVKLSETQTAITDVYEATASTRDDKVHQLLSFFRLTTRPAFAPYFRGGSTFHLIVPSDCDRFDTNTLGDLKYNFLSYRDKYVERVDDSYEILQRLKITVERVKAANTDDVHVAALELLRDTPFYNVIDLEEFIPPQNSSKRYKRRH